jgi:hypothetical protein
MILSPSHVTVTNLIFFKRNSRLSFLDPVIVPRSAKCFYSKMVKDCALTKVNSDRGFESWSFVGYEVEPPA